MHSENKYSVLSKSLSFPDGTAWHSSHPAGSLCVRTPLARTRPQANKSQIKSILKKAYTYTHAWHLHKAFTFMRRICFQKLREPETLNLHLLFKVSGRFLGHVFGSSSDFIQFFFTEQQVLRFSSFLFNENPICLNLLMITWKVFLCKTLTSYYIG